MLCIGRVVMFVSRNCQSKYRPLLRKALVVGVSGGLLLALPAAPVHADTIVEAILSAYSSNPRLNGERARQRADREKLPQARAGLFATINGSIESGSDRVRDTHLNTDARGHNTIYGVTLSQPIFDGLRTYHEIQKAKAEIGAGREQLDGVSADVFLSVTEAYLNVIRDRQIVALRANSLAVFREQVGQAQGRFKGGDLTKTGVDQTLVRLREAEGDLAQARADLAASEAYYRSVVGRHPGKLEAPRFVAAVLPRSLDDALTKANAENAKLRAAYYNLLAARYAVRSAKGALAPSVSLEVSSRRTDGLTPYNTEPNETSVRVRVAMQLFNGGRDISRISQAVAVKGQRQMEVDEARATMQRLVETSWYAIEGSEARARAARGRIASAQRALKGLLIEFNAGQAPIVNVLDGRRELIAAQVALATAERDSIYRKVELMAAMGQLSLERPGFATGIMESAQNRQPAMASPPRLDRRAAATVAPNQVQLKPAAKQVAATGRQISDPWYGVARGDAQAQAAKDDQRPGAARASIATRER